MTILLFGIGRLGRGQLPFNNRTPDGMMRFLARWLIALSMVVLAAVEVAAQTTVMPHANMVANLYAGPGTDFEIVGTVVPGQIVPIVQQSTDGQWYRSSNGSIGPWIAASAIENPPRPDQLWPLTPIPQTGPPTATLAQAAIEPTTAVLLVDTPTPVPPIGIASTATQAPVVVVPTEMPTATPAAVVDVPAATPSSTGQSIGQPFVCIDGCAVAPDPSCAIKGNVNSRGEKIYHVPGSRNYDDTDIKPEEGDRWFCFVEEAEANGFRAPLNQ